MEIKLYKLLFISSFILTLFYCSKNNFKKQEFNFYSEEYKNKAKSTAAKRLAKNKRIQFLELLKTDTNNATFNGLIGLTYATEYNLEKALEYYEKSLHYSESKWRQYREIAFIYYIKGKHTQAVYYYLKQIKINEFEGTCYHFIAECYYHLNDYLKSQFYLNKFFNHKFIPPKELSVEEIQAYQRQIVRITKYANKLKLLLNNITNK